MGDTGKGYFELFGDEDNKKQRDELSDFLKDIPRLDENNNPLLSQFKRFKEEYPNHGGIFSVGEELEIKGSKFKVISIDREELHLKLLKKE